MAEKIIRISADVSGVLAGLREIPNELERAFRFETGNKTFSAIFDRTLAQSKDVVDQIRLIKKEIESFQSIRMKPLTDELDKLQKREQDVMNRNIPTEKRAELLENIETRRKGVSHKQDEVAKSIDKLNYQLQKLTDQAARVYAREEKKTALVGNEGTGVGLLEQAKNEVAQLKEKQLRASTKDELELTNRQLRDKQSEIDRLMGGNGGVEGSRGGFGLTNVALQAARGGMSGLGIGSAGGLMTTSLGIFGAFATYEIVKKLTDSYMTNLRTTNQEALSTGASNNLYGRGDSDNIFSGEEMRSYVSGFRKSRGGAFSLYGGDAIGIVNIPVEKTRRHYGRGGVSYVEHYTEMEEAPQMANAQRKEHDELTRQMLIEKGLGLNFGELNKTGEALRYQTGQNQLTPERYAEQFTEKLRGAKVFGVDKGDLTRVEEKLDEGNELSRSQLEQMAQVDARLSSNLITAFGMIPGATGDINAMSTINTINRGITNPRNDFLKSRELDQIRVHNPGISVWNAQGMMQAGIFGTYADGTSYLTNTLREYDGSDMSKFDISQKLGGLNNSQTEALVKASKDPKIMRMLASIGNEDEFNKIIHADMNGKMPDSIYTNDDVIKAFVESNTDFIKKMSNAITNFSSDVTNFGSSITTLKTVADKLAKSPAIQTPTRSK